MQLKELRCLFWCYVTYWQTSRFDVFLNLQIREFSQKMLCPSLMKTLLPIRLLECKISSQMQQILLLRGCLGKALLRFLLRVFEFGNRK